MITQYRDIKQSKKKVYIRTSNGTVIHINPACRIPRTIKRFSGLMGKKKKKKK